MVDRLLAHVAAQLTLRFGLPPLEAGRSVLELDSSTPAKLSRHLIVRIPGAAFASNGHAGQFVAAVVAAAGAELSVGTALRADGRGAERGSLVDAAVYSRNRHFRLVWSCKGGKAAVLVPTPRFAAGGVPTSAHLFLAAFITGVDPGTRLLQMFVNVGRPMAGSAPTGQVVADAGGGLRVAWKHDGAEASAGGARMRGALPRGGGLSGPPALSR